MRRTVNRRHDGRMFIFDVRGEPAQDETVIREVWDEHTYQWGPTELAGTTVLDLGANIGAFSVWAAACGATTVRAVEPDEQNFQRLRTNLELNRRDLKISIQSRQVAAAAENGQVLVGRAPSAAGCWTAPLLPDCQDCKGADDLVVPGQNLETLLDGLGDEVVVKCDVEGAEYDLFRTATEPALRRIARLVLEWHNPARPDGLGERPWPEEPGAFGRLVETLSRFHAVSTRGMATRGGILWAARY